MIASSSLLMAYIAIMFAFQVDLGKRILQAWKRARGKSPGKENHLLHTLPYYIALTRSSCEVRRITRLIQSVDFQYEAQAHILNLPVGHNIPTAAKDSVKLSSVKLKLGVKQARWKSVVGMINSACAGFTLSL